MKFRQLGKTDLTMSELGFGGGAIGGLYRAVSRRAAFQTMETAWAAGIRYFDTAPFYGLGLSERRIGDFLRKKPREDYVLSTKVGKLLRPVPHTEVIDHGFVDPLPFAIDYDYSYSGIMRSFEFSLARLGLNAVDILFVDDLEVSTLGLESYRHHYRLFMEGGLKALEELKASGAISAYGLGVNDVGVCLDVLSRAPVDCLLLAGRYTLLDRTSGTRLLGLCEQRGTALVIGGVFNSGILATGANNGARFNYSPASEDILRRVRNMERIAQEAGSTLATAALQFPLRHPNVTSILIGTANPESLTRNLELLQNPFPAEQWGRFDPIAIF